MVSACNKATHLSRDCSSRLSLHPAPTPSMSAAPQSSLAGSFSCRNRSNAILGIVLAREYETRYLCGRAWLVIGGNNETFRDNRLRHFVYTSRNQNMRLWTTKASEEVGLVRCDNCSKNIRHLQNPTQYKLWTHRRKCRTTEKNRQTRKQV